MKSIRLKAVFLTLSLTASCSGKKDQEENKTQSDPKAEGDTEGESDGTAQPVAIVGKYLMPCGAGRLELIELQKDKIIVSGKSYADDKCRGVASTGSILEYASDEPPVAETTRLFKYSLVLKSIKFAALTQEAVDEQNAVNDYGFSEWKLGEYVSVSSLPKGIKESASASTLTQFYEVIDGKLCMGESKAEVASKIYCGTKK